MSASVSQDPEAGVLIKAAYNLSPLNSVSPFGSQRKKTFLEHSQESDNTPLASLLDLIVSAAQDVISDESSSHNMRPEMCLT